MREEDRHFFDNPHRVRWVLRILYALCMAIMLLDFVIDRHVSHTWETLWGFYAIYGFVGCVVLVLAAKGMRKVLMRAEDYYDRRKLRDKGEG